MANPANRFHSWAYRARPDVNCIIHTHRCTSPRCRPWKYRCRSRTWTFARYTTTAPSSGLAGRAGRQRGRRDHLRRPRRQARHPAFPPRPAGHRCEHRGGLRDRGAARARGEDAVAGDGRRGDRRSRRALAREAHDWISTPKRHGAAFNYYARRCLPATATARAERPFPPGPSWHFPLNVTGTSNVRIHSRHHRLHHHPLRRRRRSRPCRPSAAPSSA